MGSGISGNFDVIEGFSFTNTTDPKLKAVSYQFLPKCLTGSPHSHHPTKTFDGPRSKLHSGADPATSMTNVGNTCIMGTMSGLTSIF